MVAQCYSSVTAQGFIWQAKDSMPSRCVCVWGGYPKGEASICLGFLLFYVSLLPTLSLPHANWVSQEGGMFVAPEVLTLVHGFSFVLFSQAFLYLCLLATTIWNSFFLF